MYGQKSNLPSKAQVEVLLTKIKQYYNLHKERRSNQVVKQEALLVKSIKGAGRSKLEESIMMEKIVNILRYINALRLLGSYADAIKQNSASIANPAKYQNQVHQLLPYIMGIIYSAKPIGLNCISQFKQIMEEIFGAKSLEKSYMEGKLIPIDVRRCFQPITPTFKQINQYAIEMCQRNQFSLQALNSIGHQFSLYGGQVKIAVGRQDNSYPQQPVNNYPPKGPGGSGNGYMNGGQNSIPYNNEGYGKQGTQNFGQYDYSNGNYRNINQINYTGQGKGDNFGNNYPNNYGYGNNMTNPYEPKHENKYDSPPKPFQNYNKNNQYGADYIPSFTPDQPTNTQNSQQFPSNYLPKYRPNNFNQFKIPPPPPSAIDPESFGFGTQQNLQSRLKKL